MASRATALARLLLLRPAMPPSTQSADALRGPAALALAQAWRQATGAVGGGVFAGQPARRSVASTSASTDNDGGIAPAPPGRVAEMAAMFTCNVCDTRSAHGFSRAAYERGVVIVTCAGCSNRHLLSDRLGWFGAPGSIEAFLAEKGAGGEGGAVRMRAVEGAEGGASATLEISAEELDGWTPPAQGKKDKPAE